VDDPLGSLPDRLTFTCREDEASAYNGIVWQRLDRGPDYSNFRALTIVLVFGIGAVVLFAAYLGLVTPEQMGAVFFTAYAGFVAGGFAYHVAVRARYRAILRASFRSTSAIGAETFDVSFGECGLVYSTSRFSVSVPWVSIMDVVETSLLTVLMFQPNQGLAIPARLFPDSSSRRAFAAGIRKHAATAAIAASAS
jgi:hypothetical protein